MFKYFIIVIFLHVIMTKEIHGREEDIELARWGDWDTEYDDAIGNCDRRPHRKSMWFTAKPPVSQPQFINCFQALCY
jgi:hypothetical protein